LGVTFRAAPVWARNRRDGGYPFGSYAWRPYGTTLPSSTARHRDRELQGGMGMRRDTVLLAAILLTACGRSSESKMQSAKLATYDVEAPSVSGPPKAPGSRVPVAGPRMAYSYTIAYAFDRATVGEVQGRQLAFCRQLGPARCVVLKSTLNMPEPDAHIVSDEAVLLVDATQVGEVNRRFDALAVAGGAKAANRQVQAEDVTRQVIDVDARVRAKTVLAERLLGLIRSGNGKVGELVEAERAYAAIQEELDAARGEQADLANRVAMSRVTISYQFNDTPGPDSPIRASLATAGDTLASSIGVLVTAVIAMLPWVIVGGLVVTLIRWIRRKRGWRWPRRAITTSTPS